MGVNFQPEIYIDITDHFDEKKKAIMCHKSQNPKRLIEIIETMNRFRAMQCNLKYNSFVETYSYNKCFPFIDSSYMLPVSVKSNPFYLV